jgi:hypothetical protein
VLKIDYASPPATWREAFERADLVAVVRLKAKQHVVQPKELPRTLFRADVLDVIGGPHAGSVGAEISVSRFGGVTTANGVLTSVEESGFRPWENGESFLVFLKWHGPYEAYAMAFGPDAAFEAALGEELIDKKVRTSGVGRLAARQNGRAFSMLLTEVKAAAR